MFNEIQKGFLGAPLSQSAVKEREQAGRKLSYIEGWHAIAEANRIFGFDGWTSTTIETRCVAEGARKIGRPPNQRDGFSVSYVAKVRVDVGGVIREGVGAGHGIDVDLGLAHESAIKESETDARKRALMTFGNPFGLALYDKAQRNVANDEPPARQSTSQRAAATAAFPDRKATVKETPKQVRERIETALTETTTLAALEKAAADLEPDYLALPEAMQAEIGRVYSFKQKALETFGEAA